MFPGSGEDERLKGLEGELKGVEKVDDDPEAIARREELKAFWCLP